MYIARHYLSQIQYQNTEKSDFDILVVSWILVDIEYWIGIISIMTYPAWFIVFYSKVENPAENGHIKYQNYYIVRP